ncbi:MAG: hypothetical protein JWM33_4038 [Caulobacteraceae bacterium]|nr:hypothetical protein [Caulobacteraceae bacterium]
MATKLGQATWARLTHGKGAGRSVISKFAKISRLVAAALIALWGAYWAFAPLLFIQADGLHAARGVGISLGLLALRGLAFLWLAYVLVRRRFGDIPMIIMILVPLCLTDFITAVIRSSPLADEIGLLIISMVSLLIIVGLCALVWRLDRRAHPA